ncbi:hypothetical protein [Allosphingosinicella sp.]|jgi:hypothetical protein|uniref:hypothetical protein n=1 Tax=Allosphingosinicella sp. TaxID=2823234 RepID=UPI002F1EBE5C
MRKLILLVSAAAMAATMPALAQSQGGGKGKGGGGHPQAEASKGGGKGHDRAEHRRMRSDSSPRVERGHGGGEARIDRGRGQGEARKAERQAERADRRGSPDVRRADRDELRALARGGDRDWNRWMDRRGSGRTLPVSVGRGGCPPGLAKQNAFCLPPGQLRKAQMLGQRVSRDRFAAVPEDYLYRFADDDDFYYLYDYDGFIYRIDRGTDLVSTIFPLVSSGLSLGQPLPLGYEVYNLPLPYREQYVDDDRYLYRYDDNAIYRVDTETRLIQGVVALLSGNPLSVGAPLPAGYDVYNVPFDYRDEYGDTADSMYRYSNGGIYQVDPTTRLVKALVEMIV